MVGLGDAMLCAPAFDDRAAVDLQHGVERLA
jgi:hypothetical protein